MITAADLLHLDYTPDLTEAGIAFVCRSLAFGRAAKDTLSFQQLRRNAAGVAAELAFRRFLRERSVHFKVLDAALFTDPDRYCISLGGCRCELVSYFISHKSQVDVLHQEPELLLRAPALIPSDEFAAEYHRSDDLYIFAFVLGMESPARQGMSDASSTFLIHLLPREWSRPFQPLSLYKLMLKSEAESALQVELGGLDGEREFLTGRLELTPGKDTPVEMPFSSLAYVRPLKIPPARLQIFRSDRREAYLISPYGWGNLGFHGLEIVLAGWHSHEKFRRLAGFVNIGSRTLQFDRTRVKNLAVPLNRLEPVSALLDKGKS